MRALDHKLVDTGYWLGVVNESDHEQERRAVRQTSDAARAQDL